MPSLCILWWDDTALTKDSVSYRIVSTSRTKPVSCLNLYWCMDEKSTFAKVSKC